MTGRATAVLFCLAFIALGVAQPVRAQDADAILDPPDSALVLIPIRPISEIDSAISAEIRREQQFKREKQAAEGRGDRSKRYVELTKRERELVEQKADLAGDEAREAEKATLERQKEALEDLERFYQGLHELNRAERDAAESGVQHSRALREALERERELARRRGGRDSFSLARSMAEDRDLADLEKKTLEAYRKAADRARQLAEREKGVLERRLRLHDARKSLLDTG